MQHHGRRLYRRCGSERGGSVRNAQRMCCWSKHLHEGHALCVCCVWLCVWLCVFVCRTIDIYEDFASSLQFQVGTLSNGVSDLALALQQIKQNNGPNFFTGALLKTVSEACVPAGSAAYHFGVSACPALCPPSKRDA